MNKLIVAVAVAVLALAGCTTSAKTHVVRGLAVLRSIVRGLVRNGTSVTSVRPRNARERATRSWQGLMISRKSRRRMGFLGSIRQVS